MTPTEMRNGWLSSDMTYSRYAQDVLETTPARFKSVLISTGMSWDDISSLSRQRSSLTRSAARQERYDTCVICSITLNHKHCKSSAQFDRASARVCVDCVKRGHYERRFPTDFKKTLRSMSMTWDELAQELLEERRELWERLAQV